MADVLNQAEVEELLKNLNPETRQEPDPEERAERLLRQMEVAALFEPYLGFDGASSVR